MHASPRRAAAAIGAALLAGGLAAASANATEDFALARVAGTDRYATAANAALDAFGGGADAAVIARGDAFPDALAGSYLAGALGAPLLLTTPTDLPAVTASTLDALGAETVYLLGGTAAISDAVAAEAAGDGDPARTVERMAGTNRYGTAARIATSVDPASIGEVDGMRAAILASGETFADALAAGPVSFANRIPIILTPSGSLAPEAASALEELDIEHVIVAGGTAAVSDAVVDAATGEGVASQRVAGVNRYATSVALADLALDTFGADDSAVDLATGEAFADALAAGPAAGTANRPLLLTPTGSLAPEVEAWLGDHAGTLASGRVFGGTAAVADAVVAAAEAAAQGEPEDSSEGVLTFIDAASNTYRFVAEAATVSSTVTYADGDTFVVDGATATVGGFETSASPGDRIVSSAGRHELTNVAPTSINAGTVGNVDVENTQFDIVHPVNGDALRSDVSWADRTYTVDGATANATAFADAINEGDTIAITGSGAETALALTNNDVAGAANSIAAGANPLLPSTALKIGALGDDPDTDADDAYVANGGVLATDAFRVEGQASDYDTFAEQLSPGDAVTYRRVDGVETFELVNRAPTAVEGQAVDGIETTSGPLPTQTGGGSFTVVTAAGPQEVTYAAGGTYLVDGSVAAETEFEAAYSAGDEILFRAADAPSGAAQRIELTNRALTGAVDPESVNTDDGPALPGIGAPANSYGVLGQDGATVLRQVTYATDTPSENTYFVNGAAVTLEQFEQELDAIAAGTRSGTAEVTVAGEVSTHRLTTTAQAGGGATTTAAGLPT